MFSSGCAVPFKASLLRPWKKPSLRYLDLEAKISQITVAVRQLTLLGLEPSIAAQSKCRARQSSAQGCYGERSLDKPVRTAP